MEGNGKPPENGQPQGGQGALLMDPHHARADARLVASILSLGVVTPEVAEHCLRGAFGFAAQAIKEGDCRKYVAAMGVPLAAARVENDRLNPQAKVDVHVGIVQDLGQVMSKAEEQRRALAVESRIEQVEHPNGNGQ